MTLEELTELAFLSDCKDVEYLNKFATKIDLFYSDWDTDEIAWKIDSTIFRMKQGKLYISSKKDFAKYIINIEQHIKEAKEFYKKEDSEKS